MLTDIDTAEIQKMEEATNYREEQLANNEGKPSHSKRSSVVELWKKREGTIKAGNVVSKERAKDIEFEEKKESNQQIDIDFEQDSRQQEKGTNSQEGSERNGPELTTSPLEGRMENSKNIVASAPRRASIRDSWKKKAASIPPPQPSPRVVMTTDTNGAESNDSWKKRAANIPSPQPSPRVVMTTDTNGAESNDSWKKRAANIPSPQPSPRVVMTTDTNGAESNDSWKKRAANIPSPQPSPRVVMTTDTNGAESSDISSPRSKSVSEIKITQPGIENSSAFDELKSKWAKFGVQKQDGGNQQSVSTSQHAFAESSSRSVNQSGDADVGDASMQISWEKTLPKAVNKTTVNGDYHPLLALQETNRRQNATSARATDKASSPANNKSAATQNVDSRIQQVPSIEKETVTSSPGGEATQNDANSSPNPYSSTNVGQRNVYERSRSFDLKPSRSSSNSNLRSTSSTDDGSAIMEESPTVSRSALSSRASRRLRDIRQRQQTQRKDATDDTKSPPHQDKHTGDVTIPPDSAMNEPLQESQIPEPGHISSRSSSSIQRLKTNESNDGNFISIGVSSAFSPSLCAESTFISTQIHPTCATDCNSRNDTVGDSKDNPKSPLHNVVPDMNDMIPDEFVSEKNAHFESFKTAYDNTSFSQIAKDMTEEASSIFGLGIHTAINNLGDMFQTQSPKKKVIKRAPSPVEEVAIEVEYVADSD
eukprot:jgi/Psemu1/48986/gm1.48986_g